MVMMRLETEYFHKDLAKSNHKAEHRPTKRFQDTMGSTLIVPIQSYTQLCLVYVDIYYRILLGINYKSLVDRPIKAINILLHTCSF